MRICFTIDDVMRAKTLQIGKIYKKYKDHTVDLSNLDLENMSISEALGFDGVKEWEKFLYTDYPYEIFGMAPIKEKMLSSTFNLWHMSLQDMELDEDVEVLIANPYEFNASIGFTCFFLSRFATRVREIRFPEDSGTIWDMCDILVTADSALLDSKPDGKKSVRIEMPYNMECSADLSYKNLTDALTDNRLLEDLGYYGR